MRMMLKILIPTEAGNHTIKDGSLRKILEATMSKLKPEAAYFVAQDGLRSAMMFFDMQDVSDNPGIVEPLFMGFNAEVELLPVMNTEDLKMGLDAAMQGCEHTCPPPWYGNGMPKGPQGQKRLGLAIGRGARSHAVSRAHARRSYGGADRFWLCQTIRRRGRRVHLTPEL